MSHQNIKVSCVMPTFNRSQYVPIAIRCFTQQTYPNLELVIVDDGTESLAIPTDGRIHYFHLDTKIPTGTKRNFGAQKASGTIIANWDDDDWSSAHRVEDQVQRLLKTGKAVTGYNATVVYDEDTGRLYKNLGGPPYLASGTSQCYLKSWWEQHPFPDVRYGEDSVFSRTARLADQLAIVDPGKMMVARKHVANTDRVYLEKLKPLQPSDVSFEFFKAQLNVQPSLEYMWEGHDCSLDCMADANLQFESPVVDYKTDRIPEVKTR